MNEEFEKLKADFKRVYIHQWGKIGWNKAVNEGTLPKWLCYSSKDLEVL